MPNKGFSIAWRMAVIIIAFACPFGLLLHLADKHFEIALCIMPVAALSFIAYMEATAWHATTTKNLRRGSDDAE